MTVYKGRFAPTPSGPVHLGTLLAAVGSFLQARSQQGEWHLRIDDIDPPREVPGAADDILRTLENFGLEWNGDVVYQSQRLDEYQAAIDQLIAQDMAYPCGCTRSEIREIARTGVNGDIYPGTCRSGLPAGKSARALRLMTHDDIITVNDSIQGKYHLNLKQDVGDYILKRADGLFAYHIATVVDDAHDGFTEIVRGQDLLSITPQQIYLQRCLGYATPNYAHLPLIVAPDGVKFSKRSGALPVNDMPQARVYPLLFNTLGMATPNDINVDNPQACLEWAISAWDISKVPATEMTIDAIE